MMSDEIDENKLDIEYYELLVRQHHYIHRANSNEENLDIKMEHSYTRASKEKKVSIELEPTRTILIERPPPCPSCHLGSHEDKLDATDECTKPAYPYDEAGSQRAMDEAESTIRNCYGRSNRSDDDDWEMAIDKSGWSERQLLLFKRVERLLDLDQMARLAYGKRTNECLRRRSSIDKSVSRMRQALATVQWDTRLTQWLHGLLSSYLSPSYMVSYIEILQSLRQKAPALVEKMFHERTADFNYDYAQVLGKRPWQPLIETKFERLPGQVVIVVVPSSPVIATPSGRLQRWYQLLDGLASVVPIQVGQAMMQNQSLDQVLEHIVAVSREKIKEIRQELPNHKIVLVAFNAGAAIALQLAMAEVVASIVCIGFSYNTVDGARGAPDDRLLEITSPVLFVLGQNAQRSSQEEIESLRDKMVAHTSLVVVGSADDSLRVEKMSRQMEGATQQMVDNMILQEIREFSAACILNPPGPRLLSNPTNRTTTNGHPGRAVFLPLNPNNPPPLKRLKLTVHAPEIGKQQKAPKSRMISDLRPSSKAKKRPTAARDTILPVKNINIEVPPLYPLKKAIVTTQKLSLAPSTFVSNKKHSANTQALSNVPLIKPTASKLAILNDGHVCTDADEIMPSVPNETESSYNLLNEVDINEMPFMFADDDNNNGATFDDAAANFVLLGSETETSIKSTGSQLPNEPVKMASAATNGQLLVISQTKTQLAQPIENDVREQTNGMNAATIINTGFLNRNVTLRKIKIVRKPSPSALPAAPAIPIAMKSTE